jgi:hypothetical protein
VLTLAQGGATGQDGASLLGDNWIDVDDPTGELMCLTCASYSESLTVHFASWCMLHLLVLHLMTDVKIAKLMRLLEGDQKGRADLQRAHELIRAVVQHAPSRPPLDAAARTPLQVPLPAVVRCTCSTGSTALWLRISSANDLMEPNACPLQCCRCALLMPLQARTAQLQGAPAAVVADAPIRINLPHAVWAWPATVWHVLTLLARLDAARQFATSASVLAQTTAGS